MKIIISLAIILLSPFIFVWSQADIPQPAVVKTAQSVTQIVVLDGKKISTKIDLYSKFQKSLQLPMTFGHNLDALYDVLSDQKSLTVITISNENKLRQSLTNEFVDSILEVIIDAQLVNSNIKLNRQK